MATGHGGWRTHRARWAAWIIGVTLSAVLGLGSLAWAADDPDALQSAADAAAQRARELDQGALSLAKEAARAEAAAELAAAALADARSSVADAEEDIVAARQAVDDAGQALSDAEAAVTAAEATLGDLNAADPLDTAAIANAEDTLRAATKARDDLVLAAKDVDTTLSSTQAALDRANTALTTAEDRSRRAAAEADQTAEDSNAARNSADAAAREAAIAAERARQARAEDDARRSAAPRESSPSSGPGTSFDNGAARPADPAPPAATAPAAPAPPTARARPVLLSPFPIVRIRGRLTRTGAVVNLVSVRAPKGARVSVSCRGRGCPARVPARTARLVTFKRLRRHLRAGAVLEIRVTRPGTIGKYTRFVLRRGKAPLRRDSCLRANGVKPMTCPST